MKKVVAILVMIMMAAGFDWSFSQSGGDIVKITLKNQFPVAVGFYINDKFVCNAAANASCSVRINVNNAPFKIEAWGYDNRVIASRVFTSLERGKDVIWATGNVDLYAPAPKPAPPQPAPAQPAPVKPAPPKTAPAPTQTAPRPAAPKGAAGTFITSIAELDYQGQEIQNRVQTVSLANTERRTSLTGSTYALSGEGGIRIGNEGQDAFYGVPPITVNRSLADRLSGEESGLSPWLDVVNGTLDGLVHKHMAAGDWEESIAFSLGEAFPPIIQTRFRARPLPAPDNKWLLITAESGLISFLALDKKYQDTLISGRYRGVLVYSPADNEFLQSAATFTLYHGTDQFRIEQMYFAADAGGNQLHPVLDAGSYLDFKPEAPQITAPGPFPSWCIQADKFFDVLHLAVMTAAEGSTNQVPMGTVNLAVLNLIHHQLPLVGKVLGKPDMDAFLADWAKLQKMIDATIANSAAGGIFGSRGALIRDFTLNFVPTRIQPLSKYWSKPLYVSAKIMIDNMPYDVKLINDPAYALPLNPAPTQPQQPVQPEPQKPVQGGLEKPTPAPEPPPAEVKKPETGSNPGNILLGIIAAAAGIYGGLKLADMIDNTDASTTDEDSGGGGTGNFNITVTNNCTQQNLTSFKINGTEYGPINAKTSKTITINKTGSCTRVDYSWRTSAGFSYADYAYYTSSCGFTFSDNISPNDQPISGIAVSNCSPAKRGLWKWR